MRTRKRGFIFYFLGYFRHVLKWHGHNNLYIYIYIYKDLGPKVSVTFSLDITWVQVRFQFNVYIFL